MVYMIIDREDCMLSSRCQNSGAFTTMDEKHTDEEFYRRRECCSYVIMVKTFLIRDQLLMLSVQYEYSDNQTLVVNTQCTQMKHFPLQ